MSLMISKLGQMAAYQLGYFGGRAVANGGWFLGQCHMPILRIFTAYYISKKQIPPISDASTYAKGR